MLVVDIIALETTFASEEESKFLIFEILKDNLKISLSCDVLFGIYGLTKAMEVINPTTLTFQELVLAKSHRLYAAAPFISFNCILVLVYLARGRNTKETKQT